MVTFDDPIDAGFVLHAWQVTERALFEGSLREYEAALRTTANEGAVESVRSFRLHRKPPGTPSKSLIDVLHAHPAWSDADPSPRIDRVLLVRFKNTDAAGEHLEQPHTRKHLDDLAACAHLSHTGVYRNRVRVGEVLEDGDPSYLFNFFYTDRRETFLDTWKQTSLWFFRHTGLTSSFVLEDVDPDSRFPFVNHAHWTSLWRLVASVILRPSFKRDVVAPFEASRMLPNAHLYRRVAG